MLNRLFSRMRHGRRVTRRLTPLGSPLSRKLMVEQLEDRLVPSSVPTALGAQTQAIVNPANLGSGNQYQLISAGPYQTVTSHSITITPDQSGLVSLSFQAQAYDSITNHVGVRYLIDGQTDPNDAVFIKSGNAADTIEDISAGSWSTLYLTRLLTLPTGTHVVSIQVSCTVQGFAASDQLAIYTPVLSLVGYSAIDGTTAADGLQSQTLVNPISPAGSQQNIVAGSYQTVVSQAIAVGPHKTGVVDLAFQAQAFSSVANQVFVRYLIDGQPDPRDLGASATPNGADTSETFNTGIGTGGWHTLMLTHQLTLGQGNHTISVQVMCTASGLLGPDLVVYTPSLSLTAYRIVDMLRAADGVQSQVLTAPVSQAVPSQQFITAGTFQTVASATVAVGPNKTGLYAFSFQAQALATAYNRVWVRYLIDGQPDATDTAITGSASGADATDEFLIGIGTPVWHTLSLTRTLSLTPGNHTIAVQVECRNPGAVPGQDLTVFSPDLTLTGFNFIATTSGNQNFSYSPTNKVLTVNGGSGDDTFQFNQATTSTANGTVTSTYTLTLNGVSQTFTSGQVDRIVFNGNGGNDTAILMCNDTYLGADGRTHETREQAVLNPTGGLLQKYNANSVAMTFIQLAGFNNIYAYMGHADNAVMGDSHGDDTFVSAGSYSYMSGPGYFNLVSGAANVLANSTNGGHDQAYHYDGTGASTFTINAGAFSAMSGTDHGQSFLNKATGFSFNYGFASHAGDTASFSAGRGMEVFVGDTAASYLYAATADGNLAMFDGAYGFSKVFAYGAPGGQDIAYVHDTKINTATGFHRLA